jgi:hypothetical protein
MNPGGVGVAHGVSWGRFERRSGWRFLRLFALWFGGGQGTGPVRSAAGCCVNSFLGLLTVVDAGGPVW